MGSNGGLGFDYSVAVSSEYVDGALRIAALRHGSGKQSGTPYESIQPLGLLARPADPDTVGDGQVEGAGILYAYDGAVLLGWPTTDPRGLAKVPPLKPGGTCLYSSPGGCLVFDGEVGSLLALVPDEASKDDPAGPLNHAFSIDSAAASISLIHADGMGLFITRGGDNAVLLTNKAGTAFIGVGDSGMLMSGSLQLNGSMVLGNTVSALPVALQPALFQFATLMTAVVSKLAAAPLLAGVVSPADIAALTTALATLDTLGKSQMLLASPQ